MRIYALLPLVLQIIAWPIATLLFSVFMSVKFNGTEHLKAARREQKKTGKGIIFAANHVSEFDPILVRAGIGWFTKPMFYVSAPMKEFREGSYGWRSFFYRSEWFFKSWGSYPFFSGAHDYATSLKDHKQILEDGYDLTIFPEGGIKNKKLEPGGGVGHLALTTGSVVIPVRILLSSRPESFKAFITRQSSISIEFLQPFVFEKHDAPDVLSCKNIAKQIMDSVNMH